MRPTKALSLFAALLLLYSCSKEGKNMPRVGLALPSFSEPSAGTLRRAIETAALGKAELTEIDGQGQQVAQNLLLDSLFEKKPAAVAIEPVEAGATVDLIAKAKKLKIPLVLIGFLPSAEAMRSWDKVYFVGSRGQDSGYAQGEIVAELWKADKSVDRNKDGALQYVVIGKEADEAPRSEGFAKAMAALSIKSEPVAMGIEGKAALALGAKVEAAICVDSDSTLDAVDNYTRLRGPRPLIVGSSAGKESSALSAALASGILSGLVAPDVASQGKAAYDVAYALARNSNPAKAGWKITDAKYVWVPYMKLRGAR